MGLFTEQRLFAQGYDICTVYDKLFALRAKYEPAWSELVDRLAEARAQPMHGSDAPIGRSVLIADRQAARDAARLHVDRHRAMYATPELRQALDKEAVLLDRIAGREVAFGRYVAGKVPERVNWHLGEGWQGRLLARSDSSQANAAFRIAGAVVAYKYGRQSEEHPQTKVAHEKCVRGTLEAFLPTALTPVLRAPSGLHLLSR